MAIDVGFRQRCEPKQGGDITFMDMVDEREALGESQIQKLFTGTTVLITGGTGFLGKLMVEKLLRCCPGLTKVYLLARPKKNKEISKRLQEQFDDVLYDKLRKEQPEFIQKVRIVEGDVGQLQLGIKEEDRNKIINEVDIIFHGAATVRFDEPLKTAVEINVRGIREMMHLAHACTKLRAIVHISTAYSNCPKKEIEEKFYEFPMPGDKLIDMVENMSEETLNNITPGLLGDFPNTYAYTKAAAEDIVRRHSKGLPLALFRPAIVIGTYKDPIAGWIDNVYGPTGVIVGASLGLLHTLNCNPKAVADMVPGDMAVNGCIAAAWKVVKDSRDNHEEVPPSDLPPIYNFVSSTQKPITWEGLMKNSERHGFKVPSIQAVWYYLLFLTPSTFMYNLWWVLLHWMPAYLVDGVATIIGKKPILRKAYTKIYKFSDVIAYFATQEWKFHDDNVRKLYNEMCDADKDMFDFDISNMDWNAFCENYMRGIRVYLLKDPMDTLPKATKRMIKYRFAHYAVLSICCFGILRLSFALIRIALFMLLRL